MESKENKGHIIKHLKYNIIIFISTFKLIELIGQFKSFDSSNKSFYYLKVILLVLHLISVPLSFAGNKNCKILTVFLHFISIISNNLDWLKEKFLNEIKSIDFLFLQKYFFEVGIFLNIFIFFDSKKNIKNEENEEESKEKDKNQTEIGESENSSQIKEYKENISDSIKDDKKEKLEEFRNI